MSDRHIGLFSFKGLLNIHDEMLMQRDMSIASHSDFLNKRLSHISTRRPKRNQQKLTEDFINGKVMPIDVLVEVVEILEDQ